MLNSVCVFTGAHEGHIPSHKQAAKDLGRLIAEHELILVYGGSRAGLMGVIANSALQHGAKLYGVITKALAKYEPIHEKLTELHIVETMDRRKRMLEELSDAFIALPGGLGTFEEFFQVWSGLKIRVHEKPCALLNIDHYYDKLLHAIDAAIEAGYLKHKHRHLIEVYDQPEALLKKLIRICYSHESPW